MITYIYIYKLSCYKTWYLYQIDKYKIIYLDLTEVTITIFRLSISKFCFEYFDNTRIFSFKWNIFHTLEENYIKINLDRFCKHLHNYK